MKHLDWFDDKTILITGGTGSVGRAIAESLLNDTEARVIRILSRDEEKQRAMSHEIEDNGRFRYLIGDVRDLPRLKRAMENVDIVFHAAALKQVPSCQYNPLEAVKTNVLGTANVIDAAIEADVEKVICISTDKAVNPINTMGATKLLAEHLMMDANVSSGRSRTTFSVVRFGNVIGSRGSVVPILKKQIQAGGPVTVTDPSMTRFVMSLKDAANLVLKAAYRAVGMDTFILKMDALEVEDLVAVLISRYTPVGFPYPPLKEIGVRQGEKMHEELMTSTESHMAYDLGDMYMISPIPDMPETEEDSKMCDMQVEFEDRYKGLKKADIKSYSSKLPQRKLMKRREIHEIL